ALIGLSRDSIEAALTEWEEALSGKDKIRATNDDDELTLDDLDDDLDSADSAADVAEQSQGSFTRSDFPLLGAIARVFLALPSHVTKEDDLYRRTGFLLPGDFSRYDHVIIDEAQDFTY